MTAWFEALRSGEETWRDIPGHEGTYQVSTLGRVRSLRRVVTRSDGRTYCVVAKVLRPMVQARTGFHIVVLSDRGRQTRHYVHRLQHEAGLDCATANVK